MPDAKDPKTLSNSERFKKRADGKFDVIYGDGTTHVLTQDELAKIVADGVLPGVSKDFQAILKESTSAIGDGMSNGAVALGEAVSPMNLLANLAGTLGDPAFWQRVLLMALGAGLCIIGAVMIIAQSSSVSKAANIVGNVVPGGGVVKTAVKSVSNIAK